LLSKRRCKWLTTRETTDLYPTDENLRQRLSEWMFKGTSTASTSPVFQTSLTPLGDRHGSQSRAAEQASRVGDQRACACMPWGSGGRTIDTELVRVLDTGPVEAQQMVEGKMHIREEVCFVTLRRLASPSVTSC